MMMISSFLKMILDTFLLFIVFGSFPTLNDAAPLPSRSGTPPTPLTSDQSPLIGFDCNQTEPEILAISTLEVGSCPEINTLRPRVIQEFGQIIQKHTLETIQIRTCQLIKSTSYFKCGANWANYNVYPPSIGVIKPMTSKACQMIHDSGVYKYQEGRHPWMEIEVNKTYHHAVNEIGWTDQYGYCEGGTTYLEGKEHKGVVVQASYTLSVRESWGKVDMDSHKINIEGTIHCDFSRGTCTDAVTGTHVWTPTKSQCVGGKYKQLYKGLINITKSAQDSTVLLSVNSPPFLFTSEIGLNTYTCGYNLQMTEFPGVFYLPQKDGSYQGSFDLPETIDIEFITYLNSKITFMYHNLVDSARDMYLSSIQKTCEVERQMLKNRIEIIRLNSLAGGLSTLLKEGMFAQANGEIIHLIKCEPAPVILRKTDRCYSSLPITYKGQDVFLLPNTHIISPYSSETLCSPITPLTYKIGGQWWSFSGSYQMATAPQVLQPQTKGDLVFHKIKSFSKGGMYAIEQIEAVQRQMVFPDLRETITTDFVAGMRGYYGHTSSMDISSVMSETDFENIAEKNIKKFWGVFSSIGSTISGFIGIYFMFRLIKGVLNCFIDGKSLYQAFGCSLYLFSSIWSRLALYFLHQARGTPDAPPNTPENENEEIELRETSSSRSFFPSLASYRSVRPTAPLPKTISEVS